jgi:hypothetical protein
MEAVIQSRARLFGRDTTVPGDGWNGAIRARWRAQQLCRYETICLMCTLDESGEQAIAWKSSDMNQETSGVQSYVRPGSDGRIVASKARLWSSAECTEECWRKVVFMMLSWR